MLSFLRDATKGWTAKILLLLLVASFAVWGVSGSMLTGSGSSVISVGNTSVTPLEYRLAYDRQLNQLQRQFGNRITREQADALGLSSNVLTQLVSGALLDESASQLGLGMSDKNLAAAIGDDRLMRSAGRAVSPESFTHGSSAQRQRWLGIGLRTGDVDACDAFADAGFTRGR